ncbi:unnamed protein product [Ectocarpus sp. 12 AP-2014]
MAETEVATPPPVPTEEPTGKDVPDKREGRPDRPKREPEEVPDMTVEEAQKALNALPKAEPQPDNDEHELQVGAINESIKKIKDDIEVLRAKIDEASEARRGQGDEMGEARAVMRALKEERDEIRSHLDTMQADSARAKAALEGHDKSRRALQSSLKFKTVGEIETAIRQMEARQQTSSMSLAEEKRLIKEMEQLKTSKKTAAQFMSQEEMVKGAKDGYGAARKTESEKKAELRAVQEKLKAAFTVLEEMGAKRDEEGGGVNALYEQKKALHEEINVKIEEIKDLRSAHRAKLDHWYNCRRERTKFKRALQKAEWLERVAAKNAHTKALEEEEAKKIPYESEMVLCDTLVSYLETTFMNVKGEAPKAAAVAAPQAATNDEFKGMKMVMKKRQDEEFIVMGGGRKKGGGKKKAGGKNAAGGKNTIVHAIDTMESFSMLSIAPPPNKAAVPDAIKALKEKKAWFAEQPRPAATTAKPAQVGEKSKKAAKVKAKAPDINDEEFPGLPGMASKPKTDEAGDGEDGGEGETANGDADAAGDGDGEDKAEKVAPPTAASIVANGVTGKAAAEPEPAAEETAAPAEDAPEAEGAKEDGEDKAAEVAAAKEDEEDAAAPSAAVEDKEAEKAEEAADTPAAAEPEAEVAKKDDEPAATGKEAEETKEGGGKEE